MGRPPFYPEDDDLDLERELGELERNMADTKNGMDFMSDRAREIRKTLEAKQIDPVVKEALRLAQMAGHALGANEALGNKLMNLEKRVAVRDTELARTADYDEVVARLEEAEGIIERSKKAKARRRR